MFAFTRQLSLLLGLVVLGILFGGPERVVAQAPVPYANNLLISQVYGGGGNSGATYTHDFIEIFNSGSEAISLNGLSLQYASATGTNNFGTTNMLTALPDVSIQPRKYYLVQQVGNVAGPGDPLPPADFIAPYPIGLSANNGKVALAVGTDSLGCNGGSTPCTPAQVARIIDLMGYGNANYFEGASAAPALNNTTAAFRNAGGCIDTNNNGADFMTNTPAPRNSSLPTNNCGTYSAITFDGTINDAEWNRGLLGTASGTTFGVTWDVDFLYFGARGGSNPTSDFFVIGLDIDPYEESNSGGTAPFCGASFPDENKPDYILLVRQGGGSNYLREGFNWNSSSWASIGGNYSGSGFGDSAWQDSNQFDFSGAAHYEVKIDRSLLAIGNNDPIGVYLWLCNDAEQFFNAWPPENNNSHNTLTQFLYSYTRFASTDADRTPDIYGSRIAWATNTLLANNTVYNYFGEDDAGSNPWLRLTTTASGAGGSSCTVRAKMVGTNAFSNPSFLGTNRFVELTLNDCIDLEVDVQMRYETTELNGINEADTAFYRCASLPCAASWTAVSGGTSSRDTTNNNLSLSNVPQSQFSFWTISDNETPTAVTLQAITATTANPTRLIFILLTGLMLATTLLATRRRVA
jgi:hypothetical protein